jgi:RNA polymerase sigma factor for flagellar operon FliA
MSTCTASTTGTNDSAAAVSRRELDDVVRAHLPLVGHLVRKLLSRIPAHVSRDDLVSAGMAALATAAKAFDPRRGIPFSAFATARIRGGLLDELRGLDWASRSVRGRARRVDAARQRLTASLGRVPTQPELAESVGMTPGEINSVNENIQRAVVLSLQGFTADTAEILVRERAAGPEELILSRERIGYLHDAIQTLPERLRRVITGYFFQDLPMADIAAEMGVTESRVSQLRAEAIALLRDGLNAHLDPELVPAVSRPAGCVGRRRESYYSAVAARGDLNSRLAKTDLLAMPVAA